jgi:GTP-binding protein
VPPESPPKSAAKSAAAAGTGVRIASAEFVAGAAKAEQIPPSTMFGEAPEIAFAGRSNVGKSSLLNMLLARKSLARTSNTPGRTRQVNFFDVQIAKETPPRMVFVDLPGYGYAKVSKSEAHSWKNLIESYLVGRAMLRALYVLIDVRRGFEPDDEDLIEYGQKSLAAGLRVSVVITKLDKLARNAQKPAVSKLSAGRDIPIIATSADTGDGRDLLWKSILSACRVTSET